MTTTTSQDHRASRLEFTEGHGVDPGLGGAIFAALGLGLIVIGDFASFNIALSRTFTTMSALMVTLLTLAMTAAAVVLMLEAGKAEARRRSRNTGRAGRSPVRNRVLAWALLGAMAFLLRLAAPPEATGDTSGFGSSATSGFGSATTGSTSGFGQATEASTSLLLGPMTLHGENLASALALIAIFIAGGVGAFYLSREAHNPLLTEVRRARRNEVWTRWRLGSAQRRSDRSARRAGDLAAAKEQADRASHELAVLDDLDHQLDLYSAAAKDLADSSARVRQLTDSAAASDSELASLADEVRLAQRQADHAGDQAKALSRVLIAGYKGEPAATSGLTNGTQQ